VRPNQVNVRTDLGTAFWYSGFPQKAVAEYEKSLATEPTHPNTLFNLAIVQSEGLKDYGAAIATWEKLLKTNPQYPEKQRVLDLIEKARKQKS
jgi:tetratricopeptide (TPR) repeat protein